jgi:SHS2 domain-containing protein
MTGVSLKKYEYINHTADVEFKSYGKDIGELFKNSFLALFNVISEADKINDKNLKKVTIKESANDLEELMWYGLQDAISLSDADDIFFYDADIVEIKNKDKCTLKAVLYGTKNKPKKVGFEIKAVSRYNLKITSAKDGYSCTVVVDV